MKVKKLIIKERTPEEMLASANAVLANYTYIMFYGAFLDIPDGEELQRVANRLFAIKVEMETSSVAHDPKIEAFWQAAEPNVVRPWYMAQGPEIFNKAELLLQKHQLDSEWIWKEIQKDSSMDGTSAVFQMERVLNAFHRAISLKAVDQRTPQESMLLAKSLVVLRNFNQTEEAGHSLALRYLKTQKQPLPRLARRTQIAM